MADLDNPFAEGEPGPSETFAGRHEALTAVESSWRRSTASGPVEAHFIFGTAGMGKSAVLRELGRRAAEHQWSPAYVALDHGDSGRWAVLEAMEAAVDALYRRRPGAHGMIRMRDAVTAALADDGAPLDEVLVELGDAALDVGWGLVALLDDLHHADDLVTVATASARVAARGLPAMVVGACAPPGWVDGHRPLPMRPLDTGEITDLLRAAARPHGRRFNADAVTAIEALSGGCPRLVRVYARHAWAQESGDEIGAVAVQSGQVDAEAALVEEFYGPRLAGLSGPERRFLQALSALGGADVPVDAVSRKLGDVNRFQPEDSPSLRVRDALITLGLVYTPDGRRLYAGLPELERFGPRTLA
jgi:hypothetical protein